MAEQSSSVVGKRSAFDALIRAMRAASHNADSQRLIDTATAALAGCAEDLPVAGIAGLSRVLMIDELALPHLRRMAGELAGPDRAIATRVHDTWLAGERFLAALLAICREAPERIAPGQRQRAQRFELLVRRMRCAGNLLHWRAYAYFPGDYALWQEILATYAAACEAECVERQIPLKQGRGGQTSVGREFVRALALGSASLDQLPPDSIEIADRLIRYLVPTLDVSPSRGTGAAYAVYLRHPAAPHRVLGEGGASEQERLFLNAGGAATVLDELASVIAKGLVPAALAAGPQARERVLSVIYHLRRLWSAAPNMRRHRRHALAGKLHAVRGFQYIRGELEASAPVNEASHSWDMLDVSMNGIGIIVPAEDCDRLSVGDLVGVRAEDGPSWHVGVIRRIVRAEDGTGIVGMASIARSAVSASIDDGRNPADVLLLDPVRRGNAVRLAQAIPHSVSNDSVFLNQDGHICKLRLISRMFRGGDFEVLTYQVL